MQLQSRDWNRDSRELKHLETSQASFSLHIVSEPLPVVSLHELFWALKCLGSPRALGLFTWQLKASRAGISQNKMAAESLSTSQLQKLYSITSVHFVGYKQVRSLPKLKGRGIHFTFWLGSSNFHEEHMGREKLLKPKAVFGKYSLPQDGKCQSNKRLELLIHSLFET